MPLHRRRQLVRLAAHHRIPVLEDEVYREFRYDGAELPPLKALDESGVVIHTNAFTKVLLPGIASATWWRADPGTSGWRG